MTQTYDPSHSDGHDAYNRDTKCRDLLSDILCANARYAETFIPSCSDDRPYRHAAIVAPADIRLNLSEITGLCHNDAIFLRNAGGRVTEDTIRSLVIAIRLQNVKEIFVIHSNDDLLGKVSDDEIRCLLRKNLGPSDVTFKQKCKKRKSCPAKSPCCEDESKSYEQKDGCCAPNKCNSDKYNQAAHLPFLAYKSVKKSVINDVYTIRQNSLISKCVQIYGLIYDFKTGKLCSVCEADKLGRRLEKNCCEPKCCKKKCKKSCSSSSSSSSCSSSSSSSSCC